jgi:hypothetical protein
MAVKHFVLILRQMIGLEFEVSVISSAVERFLDFARDDSHTE